MRYFDNLRMTVKLALPIAVMITLCVGLIVMAKRGVDTLADQTDTLLTVSFERRTQLLAVIAEIRDATIQEKNLLIETQTSDMLLTKQRFDRARATALKTLDSLVRLAADDERRALNVALRASATRYLDIADRSAALAVEGELAGAKALSVGEGRAARLTLEAAVRRRMEVVTAEMQQAVLQARETANTTTRDLAVVAAVGILLASLCAALISLVGIGRPMRRITAAMDRLAHGDLGAAIPDTVRTDEIGQLARALGVFKENAVTARRLEAEQGVDADAKARRAQRLDAVARTFQADAAELTQGLAAAATEMEATARAMTAVADETSRQAVTVSCSATQTSANVQTVAAATEELAASINEIAAQVQHTVAIAGATTASVRDTDATIRALHETSERIGAVVAMISGIAAQTNLLALNATIEAARAGEAGRGFAVVAAEVKELAGQTSRATQEVGTQIAAIQEATRRAVGAVRSVDGHVAQMSQIADAIAIAMEEQGAATREIARNVQEAALGTGQVTGSIGDMERGAGETGSAAAQVLTAAQDLAVHSDRLDRTVTRFLADVAAA